MAEVTALPTKWDPFVAMDRLDDEAIIAELRGQTAQALVYQFEKDGRKVTGLSKAGVDAVVREMAKQGEVLRELELVVNDTPSEYVAQVKAGRFAIQINQQTGEVKEVLLDTVFGVKRQPKTYDNGNPNPFAYEQAVTKAARNAKMRLLREDLKQAVIKMAIEQGRVQDVTPNGGPERRTAATKEAAFREADRRRKQVFAELEQFAAYQNADPAWVKEDLLREVVQEWYGVSEKKQLTARQWVDLANRLDELKAAIARKIAKYTAAEEGPTSFDDVPEIPYDQELPGA